MRNIVVGFGPDLAKLHLGRVRGAVAQNIEVPRATKAITTGVGESAPESSTLSSSCRATAWRSAPNLWVTSFCRRR